jgi:uncharacterized repeat protein (TIGR03803 family)
MKTQFTTLHNETSEMAEALSDRKPVLALLMRLLCAVALLLPALGGKAAVVSTTLYSFGTVTNSSGDALDGANPLAGLVQASDGYFYGTTSGGGAYGYTDYGSGYGTVFKISTDGALTTIYSFGMVTNAIGDAMDGANPGAGVAQGSDGYFYGTSAGGGKNGDGTVFKISANGTLTTLHSFSFNDGANPVAPLVQGSDGYFYGTTLSGGNIVPVGIRGAEPGYGTVFKISTNGALTTLYAFGTVTNAYGEPLDGANPEAGLVQGSDGYFYGTTYEGGSQNGGTVFKISATGKLTTIHSFIITNDGFGSAAALVQGSDGYFYGTNPEGPAISFKAGVGDGTVFKISSNGALTNLYSFTGGTDGLIPAAGLVQGSDGYFYGTTSGDGYVAGTVFRISTNGSLTTLYSFTGYNDPNGLVQCSDGSFYGTTSQGGAGGAGTVFRLTIVPEFQAVTLADNDQLSLTWSTEAGGTYQLQYTSDLSSTNWINLNSPITATAATLSATNLVTTAPQRFYRLALSP